MGMKAADKTDSYWIKRFKQAKRGVIIVVGFTVLALGIAMIVLPGPAIIVIPIGLTILATQFVWARKLIDKIKAQLKKLKPGKRST
jgi:tellurite resistance protein TerC